MRLRQQISVHHAKQRGTALVAVLWVAILLSTLLAGALAVVRVEARSAQARGESLKARAAAQSGLELAAQLLATGAVTSLNELSRLNDLSINGYALRFEASIEAQKLDINLASEQTLSAMFGFAGLDPDAANDLAARVADWRDPDDLSRPNGAERRDYASAGNGAVIGNRPFHNVGELNSVLEFPEALAACLAPALTVFGVKGVPDRELMTKYYSGTPFDNPSQPRTRLGTAGRAPRAGLRHAITVTAQSPRGRREQLTGLFRINGGAQTPYEFITIYKESARRETTADCDALKDERSE